MECALCQRNQQTQEKNYLFLIHEFKHSYLYLGEHQFYRGYCVLVTKNHFREMTDIPPHVRNEFFEEMMTTQSALINVFNPKKMNLCSLGNVVEHLHWHFFPRYGDDPNFTNPPWLQMSQFKDAPTSEDQRRELTSLIKEQLIKSTKD
jgi:diadenosine tetraphosphate (Ap4A) HIT family hydrolase